jgi:hypothetical protein
MDNAENVYSDGANRFFAGYDQSAQAFDAATDELQRMRDTGTRIVYGNFAAGIWSGWQVTGRDVTIDHYNHALYLLLSRKEGGIGFDRSSFQQAGADDSLLLQIRPDPVDPGDRSEVPRVRQVCLLRRSPESVQLQSPDDLNIEAGFDVRPPVTAESSEVAGHASGKSCKAGWKRGPTPDLVNYSRAKEVFKRVSEGRPLRKVLDAVCVELDAQQIPFPSRWNNRDTKPEGWADAAVVERELAFKAIDYRLKFFPN